MSGESRVTQPEALREAFDKWWWAIGQNLDEHLGPSLMEAAFTGWCAALQAQGVSRRLTRAEILAVADKRFPRWREDIQERFVLELAEGWAEAQSVSGAPEPATFDRATALMLLSAASKSGHEGAIRLAAQLAGAAPCASCGYVNFHCRCATPESVSGPQSSAQNGGNQKHAEESGRQAPSALELLRAIVDELDEEGPDAPGHGHALPGIWDNGKPCQWCATWNRARVLLSAEAAPSGRVERTASVHPTERAGKSPEAAFDERARLVAKLRDFVIEALSSTESAKGEKS